MTDESKFRNGVKKENQMDMVLEQYEAQLTKPGKCSLCGWDYKYDGLGKYRCDKCGGIFLDEYGKVREFIDEYGSAFSINEISERTGVPRRLIDLFIRDGKFDKVDRVRRCIKCGKIITSGDYCQQCTLRELQSSVENDTRKNITSAVNTEKLKGEMHYFDRKQK